MSADREDIDLKKKILRNALDNHGAITFDDKRVVGKYAAAIDELKSEGFAESELRSTGEQSTVLEVRRKR